MMINETAVAGVFVIEGERIEDERGFFVRTFSDDEFRARGMDPRIVQCSVSFNRVRGTLRGLHYQAAPSEETKLVRCTRGAIWDVVADLRRESPTYLKWTAAELTARNYRQLYVPAGVAHGFITLEDESEVSYAMGAPYDAAASRGVCWDDPTLAIAWPIAPVVMNQRDREWPGL
ncbi:MAG: dTDP-4-dehydrorhamnose 3,5-epimerase [Thermoanaerobaculia bacterium]